MVWYDFQAEDWNIYGRLFSVNGIALSDEFTINKYTNIQSHPSVTGLSNGNAFVVWQGTQTGNWVIYGRLFSANGTALNNESTINQNTIGELPSIASLSDGNAFVVWNGDWDIYGRLFSANGIALSNEFMINQNTIYPQISTSNDNDINDNDIIIPVAIVGGAVLIAVAGGASYYMYKRKKYSSATSPQALELASVSASIVASSVAQHSDEVENKEDSNETQEPSPVSINSNTSVPAVGGETTERTPLILQKQDQ